MGLSQRDMNFQSRKGMVIQERGMPKAIGRGMQVMIKRRFTLQVSGSINSERSLHGFTLSTYSLSKLSWIKLILKASISFLAQLYPKELSQKHHPKRSYLEKLTFSQTTLSFNFAKEWIVLVLLLGKRLLRARLARLESMSNNFNNNDNNNMRLLRAMGYLIFQSH